MLEPEILQPVMFGTVKIPLPGMGMSAAAMSQVTLDVMSQFNIQKLSFEMDDGCVWAFIVPSPSEVSTDATQLVRVVYAAMDKHAVESDHQS